MKKILFAPEAIRKLNQIESYTKSEFGERTAKEIKYLSAIAF